MNSSAPSEIKNQKSKIKNPWPIALVLIIGGAFAGAVWVAVTMIRQRVELERPDYYEQDLRHGQRMEQEQRARQLDPPLKVEWQNEPRQIAITFPDPRAEGTIQFYRPADASRDHVVEIRPDSDGRQMIPAAELIKGLWRVQISWRQSGLDYYQTQSLVVP